jgi:NMT1 family protein
MSAEVPRPEAEVPSEETLPTGMLSSSPVVPDDDLDTIGLQWLLVVQSHMSSSTAGDLARIIYENEAELALDRGFASKIEPADTDKDAFIVAHPGAAEYINDDTKSFMDRYSDLLYLSVAVLSVFGSIFARNLNPDHPCRARESQPAFDGHSRYRRAGAASRFARSAGAVPARARGCTSPRHLRAARRLDFQRWARHVQARL